MKNSSHSFVAHPMLRELRCSHATGSRIGGNRWDRWAKRLIRRHARMLARLGALALTLAGRGALRYLINERWKVLSQRFYPKIRLAIQPTQRRASPQVSTPLASHHGSPSSRISEALSQVSTALAPNHGLPSSRTAEMEIVVRSMPLQGIFQRLHHVNEFTRKRQQSELTNQNVQILVRRVVRQTQRVEERVAGTLALIARQRSGFAARQSVAATESWKATTPDLHSTRGKGAGTRMQSTSEPPPPVNIEALTDQVVQQINRRMTAWRERMGKI
jgi:hypothetical protein